MFKYRLIIFKNKKMNNYKTTQVLVLVLLFISDTPFGRGWIPLGDFIPRLLLFAFLSLSLGGKLFNKTTIFLLLYYIYTIIRVSSARMESNIVGTIVALFEMLIPFLLFQYIKQKRSLHLIKTISKYAVIISFLTIVCTIIALRVNPSIARLMASSTNFERGLSEIRVYQRMGVAGFDFSSVAMFFPVVLIAYYKELGNKISLLWFLFGFLLCFLFLYKVQSSTPMILSIVMTIISIFINDRTDRKFIFLTGILIVFMAYLFPVFLEIVAPYVGGTAFEGKVTGLTEFTETGQTSGEVLGRYELYQISMDSFSKNWLMGDARAYIGGHSFILDRLAEYGIIGVALLLFALYFAFKEVYQWLSIPYRYYYIICAIALLSYMVIKNVAGMDYWVYMFVFIPCLLKIEKNIK